MVVGFALIAASFVVYFEFTRPAYFEIQSIKGEHLSKSLFLAEEQSAIKKVGDLISDYRARGEMQQVVSLAFPLNEDPSGALAELYGMAKISGLNLQSVAVSSASVGTRGIGAGAGSAFNLQKPIGTIVFNVRISGSYGAFKEFLSLLETNIKTFDIGSVEIGQIGGKNNDNFTYGLMVKTYYQTQ